jgi:hypothetical protein
MKGIDSREILVVLLLLAACAQIGEGVLGALRPHF